MEIPDFDYVLTEEQEEFKADYEAQLIWLKQKAEERKKAREKKAEEEKKAQYDFNEEEIEKIEKKAEENAKTFLLDTYMYCYKSQIFKNDTLGKCSMHFILGSLLRHKRINVGWDSWLDYRIHLILIQMSGTGKGETAKFVQRLLTYLNYPTFDIENNKLLEWDKWRIPDVKKSGTITLAALVNGYKTDKQGNIKTDKEGNKLMKHGAIERYDFFIYEEGGYLFNNSKESTEMIDVFLTAMESIGSSNNVYDKQLSDYEFGISTTSQSSFFFMTRPMGKTKKKITDAGIFQRCLFIPKEVEFDLVTEMRKLAIESKLKFASGTEDKADEKFYDDLIEEFKQVVKFAYENEIKLDPKKIKIIKDFVDKKFDWFVKDLEDTISSTEIKSTMHSIFNRYGDNMLKLSYHSACMRYSKFVDLEDIQYAFNILQELYLEQKIWITESMEVDYKEANTTKDFIKTLINSIRLDKNQLKSIEDIAKDLSIAFGLEQEACLRRIKAFSRGENAIVTIFDKGNKKCLKLAPTYKKPVVREKIEEII